MPTPTLHAPTFARPRAAGIRRAVGVATAACGVAGGLLLVGCAPSRDAAYERILRGEVSLTSSKPERFSAAFPENTALGLATADAGN